MPLLDRSKALSLGNILPFDVGKMIAPDQMDKVVAEQTQKASGAVFSVGFNLYKAAFDNDSPMSDWKRWEKAMPRALSSASRAYRTYNEGRERSSRGGPNSASTVVPYDVRDTEQMMEVLAMAGGYQPLRQQAKWDVIMARAEIDSFYKYRQQSLYQEFHEALSGGNPEEIEKMKMELRKFNDTLPEFARGYKFTPENVKKSMEMRERQKASRELGIPLQKRSVPIAEHVREMFPEAEGLIDVRKVR